MKNYERGFTLIELLVVIAIIGILAAIIAPNAFQAIEKARISKTVADIKAIKTACLLYYSDVGEWPQNQYLLDEDNSLMTNKENKEGWDGPYLEHTGKSPLVRESVPGMANPGYYYIWGRHHDSSWCYFAFNLDNDSSTTYSGAPSGCEVTDGISIALYGIREDEALKLDRIFDSEGKVGYWGSMNVISSTYWLISYMIGHTGIEGGMEQGY